MRYSVATLFRNLAAGARVALFLPVSRLRFRADPLQLVLLVGVSALVDFGCDWLRYRPDAELSLAAIGGELAATGVLLVASAIVAWWGREREVVVALPVVVLAAFVPLQLVNLAVDLVPEDSMLAGDVANGVLRAALIAWIVVVLLRAVRVVTTPGSPLRGVRIVVGAALLAVPLFLPSGILPSSSWWEAPGEADGEMNPASEPVLALQRQLQDDALSRLEDHTAGGVDLYFVGFAPDGDGGTWSERMETAKKVMEGHWGASGRTITYVNDLSTIVEAPIATISHLREALDEVAGASDPDEDVLMLYLAGRSNPDGSMRVSLPPLDLVQLSGAGLRSLLDEAGIRWRVIVLSVCAPGPFISALADENTVVIANAAADAEVAECERRSEPVSFGDAFFNESMPRSSSLTAAFDNAKRRLAEPGSRSPNPVIHVGSAIAGRLDSVRGRSGGVLALPRASQPRG